MNNEDLVSKFSGFNVNAPVFVPGARFAPPAEQAAAAPPQPQPEPQSISEDFDDDNDDFEEEEEDAKDDKIEKGELQNQKSGEEATDRTTNHNDDQKETNSQQPISSNAATCSGSVAPAPSKSSSITAEEIFRQRKEPINLVFCGHVDAGKSTIGGHLLYLTGMVDKRTLEKYEREAKEKNRETWFLSWALDTNAEERDKGKTVECGRGFFETEHKRFALLDAPGHKSYVPSMITGAAQADLAILVISARQGEFEDGFEKGGQTREHAMLVKTVGVKRLVILINKMDDPTVKWAESRYNECRDKLLPFLKKEIGFRAEELHFMPCSGFTGAFLKEPPPNAAQLCPWYAQGPPLLEYLDKLPPLSRNLDGAFRMSVADKYRDMGTFVLGKIETGIVQRGATLTLMPNRISVDVTQICIDETEVEFAAAGDNVKLRLKNIEEEDVTPGFVLCSPDNLCHVSDMFEARFFVTECPLIMCRGFSGMLHLHSCQEEVVIERILCTVHKRRPKEMLQKLPRSIKQDDMAIVRFRVVNGAICMETFKEFGALGRFTIRDQTLTVGQGVIAKIIHHQQNANGTSATTAGDNNAADSNCAE